MSLGVSAYSGYQKPINTWQFDNSKAPNVLSAKVAKTQETDYVSQYGNTCTDGVDDGSIGLGSKAACIGKGIIQTGKNIIQGALKHPFKTALMIGASFIPVVGPLVIAGMAGYGLITGAKTIANGIQTANSATNDAQAKDAWENIGVGGSTVAISAVALKGATGRLRSDLSGETAQAFRNYKQGNGELSDVIKTGIEETGKNITKAIDTVKDKFDKLKKQKPADYLKEKVDNATNKAKELVDKFSKKNKENAVVEKAVRELKAEKAVKELTDKGAKKVGSGYELKEGNTTIKYDLDGNPIKQVEVTTDATGVKTTKTIDIGKTKTTVTTETIGLDGTKTVEVQNISANGTTTIVKSYGKNGKLADLYSQSENVNSGIVKTQINGKTVYLDKAYGSEAFSNPTLTQKLDMAYRSSNLGAGDTVQFGSITTPISRAQAYGLSRFTLPATYVEEN